MQRVHRTYQLKKRCRNGIHSLLKNPDLLQPAACRSRQLSKIVMDRHRGRDDYQEDGVSVVKYQITGLSVSQKFFFVEEFERVLSQNPTMLNFKRGPLPA